MKSSRLYNLIALAVCIAALAWFSVETWGQTTESRASWGSFSPGESDTEILEMAVNSVHENRIFDTINRPATVLVTPCGSNQKRSLPVMAASDDIASFPLIQLAVKEHTLRKVRERQATYRSRHPDRIQASRDRDKAKAKIYHYNRRRNDLPKVMVEKIKSKCKKRGIPFNLTADDIKIPETCPYEGIKLIVGDDMHHDASPSLDRIIPELGYVRGNIAVISNRANARKQDMSPAELRRYADIAEALLDDRFR